MHRSVLCLHGNVVCMVPINRYEETGMNPPPMIIYRMSVNIGVFERYAAHAQCDMFIVCCRRQVNNEDGVLMS